MIMSSSLYYICVSQQKQDWWNHLASQGWDSNALCCNKRATIFPLQYFTKTAERLSLWE